MREEGLGLKGESAEHVLIHTILHTFGQKMNGNIFMLFLIVDTFSLGVLYYKVGTE